MRGQPDGESQRPGGVLGEIPGALRFGPLKALTRRA
jgi:hypothetical protein